MTFNASSSNLVFSIVWRDITTSWCLPCPYNKERAYLLTIENQDDSELS
jgi:hypothetical protein